MSTARLTEIKTVDIWQECIVNPVYLQWFCTVGGPVYWCFAYRQQRGLTTKEIATFIPYIDDLETAQADMETIAMNVQPQLQVTGVLLTTDQMYIMESLLSSTRVMMLTNPNYWETDGPKWQRVGVAPGSFRTIKTDNSRHNIELTLNLPRINTQAQ